MSSLVFRKFGEELSAFIGKLVLVELTDGKHYTGILTAVDERMNIVLDKVSGAGENVYKVAVNGGTVREIKLTEKPFDFRALAERLSRVFPGLVDVREEIGVIVVMEKIKVTERGVTEGSGLAAEKVKAIYDEYLRETKKRS